MENVKNVTRAGMTFFRDDVDLGNRDCNSQDLGQRIMNLKAILVR